MACKNTKYPENFNHQWDATYNTCIGRDNYIRKIWACNNCAAVKIIFSVWERNFDGKYDMYTASEKVVEP